MGVVSQHRFDDATLFLKQAIAEDQLGRIFHADAYVKWFRSTEYYNRPVKGVGQWKAGGALINQAIHQVDLLLKRAYTPQNWVQGFEAMRFSSIGAEDCQ